MIFHVILRIINTSLMTIIIDKRFILILKHGKDDSIKDSFPFMSYMNPENPFGVPLI